MVKRPRRHVWPQGPATSLDDLSQDELTELEMGYSMEGLLQTGREGPPPMQPYAKGYVSMFPDEETRRREWERHRHLLMAKGRPGRRPWAWWWFDRGEEPPDDWCDELRQLQELGELTDEEIGLLTQQEREELAALDAEEEEE